MVFGILFFVATTLSIPLGLTTLWLGFGGYWDWGFAINGWGFIAYFLFFTVSVSALIFGVSVASVGEAYRIRALTAAGILYITQYLIFTAILASGLLWIGSFFSTLSVMPFLDYTLGIFNPMFYLTFLIPIVISLVPIPLFAVGVHSLKRKTNDRDLDRVIICVLLGLISAQFISALGYLVFGLSLHRISIEETTSDQ
jgi:hypothetical protein